MPQGRAIAESEMALGRLGAVALRTPHAEWVQGLGEHVDADGFRHPTTRHSYEGLLVLIRGENWKVLDGIGLRVDDQPLTLDQVDATPLEITYRYREGWSLRYRLLPGNAGTLLDLSLNAPAHAVGARVQVQPLFDVRHMYAESPQEGYEWRTPSARRTALARGVGVVFEVPVEAHFAPQPAYRPLLHSMGSGFRETTETGIGFVAERRTGFTLGVWTLTLQGGEVATFRLAAAADAQTAEALLSDIDETEHVARQRRYEAIAARTAATPGLAERCFVMTESFGMDVGGYRLPEAGGWWFRTPWFRDVFEGLLSNHRTLRALGHQERIAEAMRAAARYQDPETGRIPNRLPEHQADLAIFERTGRLPDSYYHSADATLLFFTLLDALDGSPDDPPLGALAEFVFERAVRGFEAASPATVNGPPVLQANGLLTVVPWHTWTDGKRSLTSDQGPCPDLPLRVPRTWQQAALDSGMPPSDVWHEDHLPTAYLPEINAQWLRMLRWGSDHLESASLRIWASETLTRAVASYRPMFWDDRTARIANMVRAERTDWTPGSPQVVAMALLQPMDVFSSEERRRAWEAVRDRLLVYHRGRPFGLLVADSEERLYLGDAQYHEAVSWPRETPYLVQLLADLDETALCRQLLESNLDHQQHEGVLFYNHELFSFPAGFTAAGGMNGGSALVPVKNPMQWWSQWCDAFWTRTDRVASGAKGDNHGQTAGLF